jgi:Domain of unknown function (DUF4440)
MRSATQRWWLGIFVATALVAVLVELRAQTAPSEDTLVLDADQALGAAMRGDDKSIARKLLSLQFTFVDANGKIHERKDFLADLKAAAAAPPSDPVAKIYGRIGMVTGHRKLADGRDVFFLDIWAKQKRAWRALVSQEVVLATAEVSRSAPALARVAAVPPYDCKNPCQTIPYRVRSPAEQDIVNSFQAIEKAVIAHDSAEWGKHVADEFVLYGSGRVPIVKSGRIAAINRQKESNAAVTVGEVQAMRLSVYDDGAAMIATHALPDNSRPPYQAARIWVKRNGQWQMAISVQTDIK